jgi:hypothetical protein
MSWDQLIVCAFAQLTWRRIWRENWQLPWFTMTALQREYEYSNKNLEEKRTVVPHVRRTTIDLACNVFSTRREEEVLAAQASLFLPSTTILQRENR